MIQPHTFTVVTPNVVTDRRTDEQLDYGDTATRVPGVPGWIQQTSSTETVNDRDVRVTRTMLFSDSTPTLTALERIEFNGRTYRVDGPPNHLTDPSGYHHTEAGLLLVEG